MCPTAAIQIERAHHAARGLQGRLVLPTDGEYDASRKVFNPAWDRYPSAIVYCLCEADVAIALRVARESSAPLTVRSGGHAVTGVSAGAGVLIDVSALNEVHIDPATRTATLGAGATLGKFREALSPHKLHVPLGECDGVGVAGFVLGGGFGFTSTTYGMSSDSVLAMRVMLSDGSIVVASEEENHDLWWAMRGGTGGNFGILLSVTYRLHELGPSFGWAIAWPLAEPVDFEHAADALMTLQRDYMRTAPSPQLNIQVTVCDQPSLYPGQGDAPLRPCFLIRGLWMGDKEGGQAAIQPLCDLPGAVVQWVKDADFDTLNADLLKVPYTIPGFSYLTRMPSQDKASRIVADDLAKADWRSMLEYLASAPRQSYYFYMELYGGAINRYPVEKSSFIHRDAHFNATLGVFWMEEEQRLPMKAFIAEWARQWDRHSNGHSYQNYPRIEDADYAHRFWGWALRPLSAVKRKYDPDRVFRFAQMVPSGDVSETLPPLASARLVAALASPIMKRSRGSLPPALEPAEAR